MHKTFMNKKNRDEVWKNMSKADKVNHRRHSMRNQLIHPQYIDDYTQETGVTLSASDKGFGNTIYKTHFPVIYMIDERIVRY